jgi:acetylornithine deacetylase/succinyl-diaminopimelate desuccinylase-like protein
VSVEAALEHARAHREQDQADFFEELRIPSVSTLPERADDVRRNAEWLRDRFDGLGFETSLTDVEGGLHPVLEAEWRGAGSAPMVTIYGHYDVQPPDPLEEWESPPFEPTVRDGLVYARGSADNKGNHFAALKAAEHWFAAGGPPVNLRFLVEGEEEISGTSLPRYIRARAQRLKSDYVLIWDGGFANDGMPALVTGLRGIVYTELHAHGAGTDLHSGGFGGVAPNPLNTLGRIVGELKGRDGVVTIPGFYDGVQMPSEEEVAQWPLDPEYEETLKGLMRSQALEGEAGYPAAVRQMARPTLDVNGMLGGFTGEGSKTVIPATAMAKVSMRLVPGQDPKRIFDTYSEYVQELSTPGVRVEARLLGAAPPVLCGTDHLAARSISAAFERAFGKRPRPVRMGGSIPVAIDFQEALGAPMVVGGLGQPGSGAHSPHECFSLDHFHRGIETLILFLDGLAPNPA